MSKKKKKILCLVSQGFYLSVSYRLKKAWLVWFPSHAITFTVLSPVLIDWVIFASGN